MLRPLKIRCDNWWWNLKLQKFLHEKFGVSWPHDKEFKPFNVRRRGKYLFLRHNPTTDTWWFSWGTDFDFNRCPFPEIMASELYSLLR